MQVQTQNSHSIIDKTFDYTNSLYSCVLQRKQLFGAGNRYFYVFHDCIVIAKKQFKEIPDRVIYFTFDLRVIWQADEKLRLKGVSFKTPTKEFLYYGEDSYLRYLKLHLAPFVVQRKISDEYKHINILGKGSFAMVLELKNLVNNQHYAGKCIEKKKLEKDDKGLVIMSCLFTFFKQALQQEISIMRIISQERHPNLLQLKEVYEGENSIYLIMDIALGNTLNKFVRQKKYQLTPSEVQQIMKQTLEGIHVLHSLGIMHRDLKPDNLIFFEKGNLNSLKIVDFGLAVHWNSHPYMYPKCGTPGYIAPEILKLPSNFKGYYSTSCDIFSLGCIFFMLLTGEKLFQCKNKDGILKANKDCEIKWDRVQTNSTAKNLLEGMLEKNEQKRLTAAQCLSHQYFLKNAEQLDDFQSELYNDFDTELVEEKENNIKTLLNQNKIYGNPFINHTEKKEVGKYHIQFFETKQMDGSIIEKSLLNIVRLSNLDELDFQYDLKSFEVQENYIRLIILQD